MKELPHFWPSGLPVLMVLNVSVTDVLFEKMQGRSGALGVMTLNRPKSLNALTYQMIQSISHQLDQWAIDEEVKAVLIQSHHEKAFCAGGDILYVYQAKQNGQPVEALFKAEYCLNQKIYEYSKPYIAFLNGITMGGGVGISIYGSHRVGTEKLLWAMPETGIGFFPDVGGSYFFSRCKKHIGVYLALTGARLKIANAVGVGFIDYYIPGENLERVKQSFLETPLDFGDKEVVSNLLQNHATQTTDAELLSQGDVIEEIFSSLQVEEIFAKLSLRKDTFSHETLNSLKTKSPTSLKVTRQQIHRGKSQSMNECMQMEFVLAKHFLQSHDFFEGIRAILVDKDQSPHWRPAQLEEVSDEAVEAFFVEKQVKGPI